MEAIISDIARELIKWPTVKAALVQIFIVGIAVYLAFMLLRLIVRTHHERTSRVLAMLANPHCPAASQQILSDYIEVAAFEAATGATVNREEREILMSFYKKHREKVNPREIGKAMRFLQISEGKITKGIVFRKEIAQLYANIFLAALSGFALLLLLVTNGPSVPSIQTTVLAIEFVVISLGASWMGESLRAAKNILRLEESPTIPFDEPFQVSSDS